MPLLTLGLPAPEADRLRKRLADPDTAQEAAARFLAAAERAGVPKAAAEQVCGTLRRQEG